MVTPVKLCLLSCVTCIAPIFAATASMAEDAATPGIAIELSAADDQDGACRMSFVIRNHHPQDIDGVVFETVLFGANGQVARMTLLDLEDLPTGRPRVRQFQFDGMGCAAISSVLINGADSCLGEGLAPGACDKGLVLSTRTNIELVG